MRLSQKQLFPNSIRHQVRRNENVLPRTFGFSSDGASLNLPPSRHQVLCLRDWTSSDECWRRREGAQLNTLHLLTLDHLLIAIDVLRNWGLWFHLQIMIAVVRHSDGHLWILSQVIGKRNGLSIRTRRDMVKWDQQHTENVSLQTVLPTSASVSYRILKLPLDFEHS